MKDDDLVESLRAENRRLIKRLEKNGIDWQLVPTPKVV
ncbi:MAG: helicase, partial [Gammaproteobacteria bacterium]|nr:helicase [Gammaproteobacteria bacterium]